MQVRLQVERVERVLHALDVAEEMLGLHPLGDAAAEAGVPSAMVRLPDELEPIVRATLGAVRAATEGADPAGSLDVDVTVPDGIVDVCRWFAPRTEALTAVARQLDTPARWFEAMNVLAEVFDTAVRSVAGARSRGGGDDLVSLELPPIDVRRAGEVFARGLEAFERLRSAGTLEQVLADATPDVALALEGFSGVRDVALAQWAAAVAEGRSEVRFRFTVSRDEARSALSLSRRVQELIGDFELMRAAGGVPLDESDRAFIKEITDGGEDALRAAVEASGEQGS